MAPWGRLTLRCGSYEGNEGAWLTGSFRGNLSDFIALLSGTEALLSPAVEQPELLTSDVGTRLGGVCWLVSKVLSVCCQVSGMRAFSKVTNSPRSRRDLIESPFGGRRAPELLSTVEALLLLLRGVDYSHGLKRITVSKLSWSMRDRSHRENKSK